MRTLRGLAGLAFATAFAAACSAGGGASPSAAASAAPTAAASVEAPASASVAPSPSADACAPEDLALKTAGKLTIGADNPAYPPYFEPSDTNPDPWELGDPTNGKGFESAVGFAIADEMGFAKDAVTWIYTGFNNAIAPGPKDFDMYITQVSYSPERAQAIDISDGYYDLTQSLVVRRQEQVRQGDDDRRPQGHAARRPGRDDQPQDDHRRRGPVQGAEGLRLQRRCGRSPPERADRRAGGRPADRVLRGRRAAGRWDHRRPVRGLRGRRALRRGAGQGQPARPRA